MRLHITSTEHCEATWWIAHRRIRVESLRDCRPDPDPAYRVQMDGSRIEIPNGTPGLVYFGQADERPELPFVRDLFPEHHELLVRVEAAYWDAVKPLGYSRLQRLDPTTLDYTTDQWTIAEIREIAHNAGQFTQPNVATTH
ncbi:hypothetical protein F3087_45065 [Nocardia colli]|uniref:Uncharacterized protein n=1 Tax=Nocardia colli TaxID=2545717 RepID=A0A5N0DJW4_9NOCA|nr:hypothetical protein [Nocardia colli]KAA8877347.1 hypothetical protein F3087_45065 [Nocardia colli]